MLDGIIRRQRRSLAARILNHYREQYLPHTVLLPNARFGLYAAAREILSPGDQVLISPITCRSVIDALLAAEVRPVFVDIEMATGNIDVARIPGRLLRGAKAVVTTNLYGNPDCAIELDRIARAHRLLLIEDCAHVLSTSIEGRPIGAIGDISVFSFKKYFDEPGGVAALRSEEVARRIEARVASETTEPPPREERVRYLQSLLARTAGSSATGAVSRLFRHPGKAKLKRDAGTPEFSKAGTALLPTTAALWRVERFLARRQTLVSERIGAARKLLDQCPLEPKTTRYQANVCPMVVPFCSPRRDQIIGRLRDRGIPTYFLYSPPMNRVYPELASTHKINADGVDHWCRTIFPVDLRYSRHVLAAIRSLF